MKTIASQFLSDTSGVTAIEYGVLAALISVVIISSVRTFTESLGMRKGRIS
jgi:pilus assembly protein Flp/PilA